MNSKPSPHLFLFAGEKSGDLHGAPLLAALQKLLPETKFSGVAGPEMRKFPIEPVLRMEDFEVMGFTDVIYSLPKLWKQFYVVRDHIIQKNPDGVVLIDYPGFNLRLAKALRKQGYKGKIIQYISPTVWAHGKGRIDTMCAHLDLLMTIYPFEQVCYEDTPLKVQYVGNPLQEYIKHYQYQENWKNELGIPEDASILSLFPGSRESEIVRNFPVQLEAAEMLLNQFSDHILAISCSSSEHKTVIEKLLRKSSLSINKNVFFVPRKFNYELMRDSRTAIAKSGTVTLELALHRCPTVVTYKLTALNRFIATYILKLNLSHFCIVNILAGKEVFPELIAHRPTAKNLYEHLCQLIQEGQKRSECIINCNEVSRMLSSSNASQLAAQAVVEALQ